MNINVLKQGNGKRLVLFFNGWGAPASVVSHLSPGDEETAVAVCSDYTSLTPVSGLPSYEEVHLVAWSMGVWAAEQVLQGVSLASATAINGTPFPADDERGIPLAVFLGTLNNLSEDTFHRFTRRMCGSRKVWDDYCRLAPGRSVDAFKAELASILQQCTATVPAEHTAFPWTQVFLSREDRIFPFTNLERYWSAIPCERHYLDAPHYPFYLWNEWKQLLPR